MTISEENKAEMLRFIDSHLFLGCCKLVADRAAANTDFQRPAADLGLLLAREKGVNEFPKILREILRPSTQANQNEPRPKSLQPERLKP